jgi:hypothetical protein
MRRIVLAAAVVALTAADADACGRRLFHRRHHANYGVGCGGGCSIIAPIATPSCPVCPSWPAEGFAPPIAVGSLPPSAPTPATGALLDGVRWFDAIDQHGNRVRVRLLGPAAPPPQPNPLLPPPGGGGG